MPVYVVPTRDRPAELAATLGRLGRLSGPDARGLVVVADNGSAETPVVPRRLANGLPVELIRIGRNAGAAARNDAAEHAVARLAEGPTAAADPADAGAGEPDPWLVMLDDDSHPLPPADDARRETISDILARQPDDVAAVTADIALAGGPPRRESGGLPEVFVGCGVAVRARVFLGLGGYDHAFNYYVEEYDLAARVLLAGMRVAFEPGFRVVHRKVSAGRDMDAILARLVRNNGWIAARYAPADALDAELAEVVSRYRRIAEKEDATAGYERGLAELDATLSEQPRRPMPRELWDRFTGLAHARAAVAAELERRPFRSAALVCEGKNAWAVRTALEEAGVEARPGLGGKADALAVATMSPGPMLDAADLLAVTGRRVVLPWLAARTPRDPTPDTSPTRPGPEHERRARPPTAPIGQLAPG